MPVFNGALTVEKSINSILNQTYKDFEIIIVDDGSKDNSYEILNNISKENENIKLIHKDNGGVSSARNIALSKACGEYIWFFDCDDLAPDNALKILVSSMKDNVDLVIAGYKQNEEEVYGRLKGEKSAKEMVTDMITGPGSFYYGVLWNKLYRKEIIDNNNLSFDESVSWCEDLFFNTDYFKHISSVSYIEKIVYNYLFRNPENKIKDIDIDRQKKVFKILCRKYENNSDLINEMELNKEVSIEKDKAFFTDCYNYMRANKASSELFNMVWNNELYIKCLNSDASREYKKMKFAKIMHKVPLGKVIFSIMIKG